jgi:hypothetical protein
MIVPDTCCGFDQIRTPGMFDMIKHLLQIFRYYLIGIHRLLQDFSTFFAGFRLIEFHRLLQDSDTI